MYSFGFILIALIIAAFLAGFSVVPGMGPIFILLTGLQIGGALAFVFFGTSTLIQDFEDSSSAYIGFVAATPIMVGTCALGAVVGMLISVGFGAAIGACCGIPVAAVIVGACLFMVISPLDSYLSSIDSESATEVFSDSQDNIFTNDPHIRFRRVDSLDSIQAKFPNIPPYSPNESQTITESTLPTISESRHISDDDDNIVGIRFFPGPGFEEDEVIAEDYSNLRK
jgi:hypothetical protein